MNLFVECDIPSVMYRNTEYVNRTVNVLTCKSVACAQMRWYPDNTGIPSIIFFGNDVEWAFPTEKERDAQYVKLMALHLPQ